MDVFTFIILGIAVAFFASAILIKKRNAPLIIFLTGPLIAKSVYVTDVMTGGRDPEMCTAALLFPESSKTVSRGHFRLRPMQELVEITDLSSSFGTFVNGVRLTVNEPKLLKAGDRVQIGGPDNEFIMAEMPGR